MSAEEDNNTGARMEPSITPFAEAFDMPSPPALNLPDGAVAIVLVYNEMLRLPHFLDFHRRAGVQHFLVVDNASTDGSGEFLRAQPDVSYFPSAKPYRHYKAAWRQLLADTYLNGRWALFSDADELLVFPGWPARPLSVFLDYCGQAGYEGVFAPMIDMYSDRPLKSLTYEPGGAFLDACPYFDGDGYRLMAVCDRRRSLYPAPRWDIYGGARERLFSTPRRRAPNALDRWILRRVFGMGRRLPAGTPSRLLDRLFRRAVRGSLPETAPLMSKIPLLRWRKGYRFYGGPHNLSEVITLAPDWAALLHFKYLPDFTEKADEAVARAQHACGAYHYKFRDTRKDVVMESGALYSGSRRFRGVEDLEMAGLMRVSSVFRQMLQRPQGASRAPGDRADMCLPMATPDAECG